MKPGIPWSVKGIDAEAREAAKDAARKAGMTLGEWLNARILERADDDTAMKAHFAAKSRGRPRPAAAAETTSPDIADKLDALARQIAGLAAVQPARDTAAERVLAERRPAGEDQKAFNSLIERLERSEKRTQTVFGTIETRLDHLGSRIDGIESKPLAVKAEDVPGYTALESAVRNIVDHIEVSEKRTRDTMKSLQERLSEVSTKVAQPLKAADQAPAIARLEKRLGEVARKIETGGDAAGDALKTFLEGRLAELAERIDTVRHSAEAIGQRAQTTAAEAAREESRALEERLAGLVGQAEKKIRSTPVVDLAPLQSQIDGLAQRVDAAVSQTDDVEVLRTAIEQLSSRVETAPALPLAAIENRLSELGQRLDTGGADGVLATQIAELDGRMRMLDSQVAELAGRGGEEAALRAVEHQLAHLGQRVGETETRLSSLAQIEEAIARLYQAMEDDRARGATLMEAGPGDGGPSPELQALHDGLAAVRASADAADRRNQETLEAVHDTLAQIIEKLAAMEAGEPFAAPAAMVPAPAEPALPADFDPYAGLMPAAPEPVAAAAEPAEAPVAVGPVPDFDQVQAPRGTGDTDWFDVVQAHLERQQQQEAAAAAAAPAGPVPASTTGFPDGREDFIAAARRAAQAAAPRSESPVVNGLNFLAARAESRLGEPDGGERGGVTSLFRRRRSAQVSDPAAEPVESGTKRRKLILAGLVLLAAASAYALNSSNAPAPSQSGALEPAAPADTVYMEPAAKPTDPIATGSLPRQPDADVGATTIRPTAAATDSETMAPPLVASVDAEIGSEALRQAALAGDINAQFVVASRYLEGRQVQQDFAKAFQWYEKAAGAGLAAAQYRLGTLYERGHGVQRDVEAAKRWYTQAARQGNVRAMHNLAVVYADTSGTPQFDQAAYWFQMAAGHGLPDSQYNLAVLAERGLGMAQDTAMAYKWYSLAAAQGDKDGLAKQAALKPHVGGAKVAAIDAEVAGWRPSEPDRAANMVAITDPAWEVAPEQQAASPAATAAATDAGPVEPVTDRDIVQKVQRLLAERGYDPGSDDGVMGSKTANAIRLFQLKTGLPVNGSVTTDLLRHLENGVI